MDNRPIGVFDSGVGGISVMRDLYRMLPQEDFLYLGDNLHAPYGTKNEADILALVRDVVAQLLKQDIKALVIACNTATSAAAAALRRELPIPVIGMEPALKPAALSCKKGLIAVMATPATLRQNKFRLLYEQYGQNAVMLPCPGLMEFVERSELSGTTLENYLRDMFQKVDGEIGAVVLGCTHYVFLRDTVSRVLPDVPLFDGNDGTARRLLSVLREKDALARREKGSVTFETTGDPDIYIPLMKKLFATK